MTALNIGIIGVGNIGSLHASYLTAGEIPHAKLVAIADIDPARLTAATARFGALTCYDSAAALIADPAIDAVIIATPHYFHPLIAAEALAAGKHVLSEKPAGVYTQAVQRTLDVAAQHPELTYALMYNQRMNPAYQKARALVQDGTLGELRRTNWIITDWYRSQSYYNSGGWRATWAGEGGGVLLNQDPHQLDLWQWICGMPSRVMGFTYNGKRRDVEVETEATAYVEYENGATGVFVTTTTETPGTNRFEIVGSRGKLVIEDQRLRLWLNAQDEADFNRTYQGGFGQPDCREVPVDTVFDGDSGHQKIVKNFVSHILDGAPLMSPAAEGLRGLSISNAIYLSSWEHRWVDLPIDGAAFLTALNQRRATSKYDAAAGFSGQVLDTKGSY
ncbi:Gfo/Idh/MocA family protein [Lacticaseibacillus kribbianus]|uniref:Gfo/Idh/MocA family protein n=1 Tax=Lacticaseibacillus kribbianus TaxID=2926292 RepID=UPI001CD4DDB5|nr:Gfo/Idh/MocA family oxidoreductase [Lacticaseibacillus kribbianus]